MILISCAALIVGGIAGAVVCLLMERRGIRRHVGERVVVQTKDDRSLRGVLTGVYTDCVVVGHFEYLDEANPTDLPGEATVRFDNLSWLHRLGAGD